jgi:hypothetical protein
MPSDVEALGPDADDTDIIAYAEANDWVVFTDGRRFLIDDEGENPSGEPIDADCGVLFYTQNTVRQPGPAAEAIQAIAEAFADHREIDMYINDWIDRNR